MNKSSDKPKDKHSVVIAGHATSVTLEPEFWAQLQQIAKARNLSLAALIAEIDKGRTRNLSAALRVYVLAFLLNTQRG